MTTITKSTLAAVLFQQIGLNKREAGDFTRLFFEEIKDGLARDGVVKLSGFGNFELRAKNERLGRNPKTGEAIPITARHVVTFKPSVKLRQRVAFLKPPKSAKKPPKRSKPSAGNAAT